MTKELAERTAEIFLQNMLVHILYMVEYKNSVNIIFVCNSPADDKLIIEIENSIAACIHKEVNVLDIYDFSVSDRFEIIQKATVIYCEYKIIKQAFELETATAMKAVMDERTRFIERKNECSTYYLQ